MAILLLAACGTEGDEEDVAAQAELDLSTTPTLTQTYRSTSHRILAVDEQGTVFATAYADGHTTLRVSTDARTWTVRAQGAYTGTPSIMAPLSDGALLLETKTSSGQSIWRSRDRGTTWTKVLALGSYRILGPRSIAELDGSVYLAEYQSFSSEATPVRLWVSQDRGRTWSVRYTFRKARHLHALLADPLRHELWAFTGDQTGGLLRSRDRGATWSMVLSGWRGVAVEGVLVSDGILYGRDSWWLSSPTPAIVVAHDDGTYTFRKYLPEPASSTYAAPGGGWLVTATHEPSGPWAGVAHAYVYGSSDGVAWRRLASYAVDDLAAYGRADVHYTLASGEVVIQLANVSGMPTRGGYVLARITW